MLCTESFIIYVWVLFLFFYITEFDMIAVCSLLDWINVHESPSPPL